jgi:hypothetical protein
MTRRVAWLLTVCLASVWPGVEAFQQVRSGTGRSHDTPVGDSVIAGTVLADDGTPVDRAIVTILGSDGPGLRASVTDAAGEFSIGGLPAGSFALWATKPGFVTSYYGSRRAGRGPAIPIALASRQRLTVTMRMLRGASIAGTITDPSGRPLAQVSVHVRPVSSPGTVASAAQHSATDGQGGYRIFGLAPGEYIVEALPPPMPNPHAILVTAGEVKWALQQGPRLSLGAGGTASAPPEGYAVAYPPTFFPGVAVVEQAAKVAVSPGEQRDATFSLQLVRAASISGNILVSGGQPTSRVHLALVRSEPDTTPSLSAGAGTPGFLRVPVSETGQFSASGVVPGAYTLWARSDPSPPVDARGRDAPTLWGRATLIVNGSDVSGVVLRLESGARVSGTIRFDGASQAPALDGVQITLSPRLRGGAPFTRSLAATPDASGRFLFSSVPPGPYDVQVGLGELTGSQTVTWALESATVSGHDVADGTLDVGQGVDIIGVTVTLTDQQTRISGTLFDSAKRPTSQFSLLLFSVDRRHWTPRSRRVQFVQPAVDGTFSVEGLPSGEYFVVAVTTDTSGIPVDEVYLQQLAGMATRITLARGERRRVDFATATR